MCNQLHCRFGEGKNFKPQKHNLKLSIEHPYFQTLLSLLWEFPQVFCFYPSTACRGPVPPTLKILRLPVSHRGLSPQFPTPFIVLSPIWVQTYLLCKNSVSTRFNTGLQHGGCSPSLPSVPAQFLLVSSSHLSIEVRSTSSGKPYCFSDKLTRATCIPEQVNPRTQYIISCPLN